MVYTGSFVEWSDERSPESIKKGNTLRNVFIIQFVSEILKFKESTKEEKSFLNFTFIFFVRILSCEVIS
jgi:hypothetical protein